MRKTKTSEGVKNKKIGKKADLPSGWTVAIILLIIGFAILLIFFFRFMWGERIDKEICHQSVVYRATLPSLVQDYIPLKCKTVKYCVTSGIIGSNCKEVYGSGKGVIKVKVKNKQEIEKFLAKEMAECWSMMGEGKVGLFSQFLADTYGIGGIYSTCVICDRIAFDIESLTKKGILNEKTDIDIEGYMKIHKIPTGNVSYTTYFAGEEGKVKVQENLSLDKINENIANLKKLEDKEKEELKIKDEELDRLMEEIGGLEIEKADETILTEKRAEFYSKLYEIEKLKKENEEERKEEYKKLAESTELGILFMQIIAPEHGEAFWNTLKTVGGITLGSALIAPKTTFWGLKGIGKLCTSGGWVGPVICAGVVIAGFGYQQINVFVQRNVAARYCGDISAGDKAREGCSVIRTVNYDEETIPQFCSVIESIP